MLVSFLCVVLMSGMTVFQTYTFESYATAIFACIRAAVHIKDADFVRSLVPDGLPYLEFISNSRSGQDFYFT